jgi:hypothetical protein
MSCHVFTSRWLYKNMIVFIFVKSYYCVIVNIYYWLHILIDLSNWYIIADELVSQYVFIVFKYFNSSLFLFLVIFLALLFKSFLIVRMVAIMLWTLFSISGSNALRNSIGPYGWLKVYLQSTMCIIIYIYIY